ncbi:MAG: VIT domain-containing protein [Gemmataceae bacterium]
MRRTALVALALLAALTPLRAAGLLIPEEKSLPPLAMVDHKVTIAIEDQVAITTVQQTFRNHTDRALEATYLFPVPRGASVDKFVMTVDGKEVKGELLPADKAREVYNGIVRRTLDPGLLEHVGGDLFRMRVFPVPPKGDQKVSVRFNSLSPKDGNLVQYTYPLKHDGKAVGTLEKYAITATVKSMHGLRNVYSPTHALALRRVSDAEVHVHFEKDAGALDRDFLLFYSSTKDDVGLTALTHRPLAADKGYATLLITPKFSLGASSRIPQDVVLVLDTSGSMRGPKMDQAKTAMRYCLDRLGAKDRFAIVEFSTGVRRYEEKLLDVTDEQLTRARKWVDELEATGGTNIDGAMASAFDLRTKDADRPFTVAFFTDGQPTIGETNPDRITKNVLDRNTANTRVFTFGVGNDVNTVLLDTVAERTRAVSTYVRPEESIEAKVAGLHGKMTSPVLTNLKLTTTGDVKLNDIYPPELPDLFAGGQLEVMARFSGKGAAALKLAGKVGKEDKEFVYELTFPEKTDDAKEFVEQLWARRKVGFLLDQIRANGEKPELKDEVLVLAKKYGITTPYTSWLIVPDAPVPGGMPGGPGRPLSPLALSGPAMGGAGGAGPGAAPRPVLETFRAAGDRGELRGRLAEDELKDAKKADDLSAAKPGDGRARGAATRELERKESLDRARDYFALRDKEKATTGKSGVDLAVETDRLRRTSTVTRTAVRAAAGRQMLEVGGVWVDDAFTPKTEAVVVKAMSDAYFKLLEKHPKLKEVLTLGNHLVWITPSGKALVIDTAAGKEALTDAEVAALFAAK